MSLGKSKVANVRDVDRDESHCGWMLAMIKVDFYKVKLNGLLSGEGCYQGGSISTADAVKYAWLTLFQNYICKWNTH